MEKKFKHRKTGWVAVPLENNTDIYKYDFGQFVDFHIHLSLLEDSCDWEEIVEKDYEILKVEHKYNLKDIEDALVRHLPIDTFYERTKIKVILEDLEK